MSGILTHKSSATGTIEIAPPARWTLERKFDLEGSAAAADAPFSILLLDRQFYQAANACFVRHVRAINTTAAAARLAEIKIPFAPHREELTLHWIRIWRDGGAIDQSASLKQLTLAESHHPNRLTTHCTLTELRAGDTLDIAYTTRATTPTEDFFTTQPVRQRVHVQGWHLSLIAKAGLDVVSRCNGMELEPVVSELKDGSQFYRWTASDVAPAELPKNTPAWHHADPELQISTSATWDEVGNRIQDRWAAPGGNPAIDAAADSLLESAADDAALAAQLACRMVQGEIETMPTVALTLTPITPAEEVLESGSGDAKSKATLLVSLLRRLKAPAAPVLVSSRGIRSPEDSLPSPERFDHVIVRARVGEKDAWIDPCASHEAGSITQCTLPPYGSGLQLSSRGSQLIQLPAATGAGSNDHLSTLDHFVLSADLSCRLTVTRKASGVEAIRLRDTAPDTLLNELQERFPSCSRSSEPNVRDDTSANVIEIKEEFHLPSILAPGFDRARFTPASVIARLPPRPDPDSAHPQALEFPCNVSHVTVVDTPWATEAAEKSETLQCDSFSLGHKLATAGKRHTVRHHFRTLRDHIPPDDLAAARMRVELMRPLLTYSFSPPVPAPARLDAAAVAPKKRQRIAPKTEPIKKRDTKAKAPSGFGWLLPFIGAAAAIALVLTVRSNFKKDAAERSGAIRERKIATMPPPVSEPPVERTAGITLPDDPLMFAPSPALPPLTGPDGGLNSVEFDMGSTTAPPKASDEKNAVGSDWKLAK